MKEKSLEIHNFNSKWFKLNYGQTGFYIVNYDDKSLERLKKVISEKKIDVLDRAAVINDLFTPTYRQNNASRRPGEASDDPEKK